MAKRKVVMMEVLYVGGPKTGETEHKPADVSAIAPSGCRGIYRRAGKGAPGAKDGLVVFEYHYLGGSYASGEA